MTKSWKHPKLGNFKYDDDFGAWVGEVDLPAFAVFKWEADPKEATGKYELHFQSEEGEEPTAGAIAVALRTVDNQAKLAPMVAPTLWDEFNGRGPKSIMWWYDDLKQVAENFGYDERPAPNRAEDLPPVMCFTGITIHEEVYGYDKPAAELGFSAVFEEEHGVGVLTDGIKILGTGYSGEASPFGTDFDE